MTFRRRVAVLVAAAIILVGAAVLVVVYVVVRGQLRDQAEDELEGLAAVVRTAVSASGQLPAPPNAAGGRPPNIPRIIDSGGSVLDTRAGDLSLPVTREARAVAAGSRDSSAELVSVGSERYAVVTLPLAASRAVQVARSFAPVDDTLRRLLRTSLVAGGGVLVTAPAIGYLVAGGALVPVRRLSRTAQRVTETSDLGHRAAIRGDDELASLAASFNAMLDRLEDMVGNLERAQRVQRQLVADASHELRSPLTALRANVELLALSPTIPVADRRQMASDTLAQIDDLSMLMGQLIDLAREDERAPSLTPVRLDHVVEDAVERARQRHPAVTFTADLAPATVAGSEDALARAVVNLLDNAGKWSPAGGSVRVRLRGGTLEVRDDGPGIGEADLPHVFQRFYRGSRTQGTPGSGLGLAIVGQVVASHGGEVWAESAPGGGALFKLKLPQGDGSAI